MAATCSAYGAATLDTATLTPNALKAVLQFTAFRLKDASGTFYDTLTQGTGEVNAEGALRLAHDEGR